MLLSKATHRGRMKGIIIGIGVVKNKIIKMSKNILLIADNDLIDRCTPLKSHYKFVTPHSQ